MLDHFRLVKVANELGGSAKEGDTLNAVEALSKLLGRVIVAAAPSIGTSIPVKLADNRLCQFLESEMDGYGR